MLAKNRPDDYTVENAQKEAAMLFQNITAVGENYEVLEDVYLATQGDKIVYLGKEKPAGDFGPVYDGRGKAALPGFVNLHSHLPMTLLRGFGEGLPLHRWLDEKMLPFESRMSTEDKYWASLLGVGEMLAGGTVSFTDMYAAEDAILRAAEESGIKANLSCGLFTELGNLTPFCEDDSYAETQMLRRAAAALPHDRVAIELSIHAEFTNEAPAAQGLADYARAEGMRIHLHLSETQKEHEEAKARRGMTPARWFESLGVFEAPVIAAHCVWIEGEDFEILARSGATVAHNPTSNLKLGSGIAPLPEMLEKGVRVGIGTDGCGSNNNLNMLEETTLASLLQKGLHRDPSLLPPTQLLRMACQNGALAQGREDCGMLKVGNRADIAVFRLSAPHLCPQHDLLANVFYAAGAADVALTMVDGRVLYQNGEFLTIDMERVQHEARQRAARLAAGA